MSESHGFHHKRSSTPFLITIFFNNHYFYYIIRFIITYIMKSLKRTSSKNGVKLVTILFFFTSLLFNMLLPFCQAEQPDPGLKFTGASSYKYVGDQLDFGYRIPGTQASRDCANYFKSSFESIDSNFTTMDHNFTIHDTQCQNVLFKLNDHLENIVILAAHYDSRARATKDDYNTDAPVPGANDGASGSAVLIELAEKLYKRKANLDCEIWFLFIDAEDQGYDLSYGMPDWDWVEGSKKFVQDIDEYHDYSSEEFDAMILLDMVGGTGLEFIDEQYSDNQLLDELFQTGRDLGYTDQFPSNPTQKAITDDHLAFKNYGIKSADLIINFWNNPAWPHHHTTDDDMSNIKEESLKITGQTVEKYLYNNYWVDTAPETPENDGENDNNGDQVEFPWTEYLVFLILLGAIIATTIISILVIRKNARRKAMEMDKPRDKRIRPKK